MIFAQGQIDYFEEKAAVLAKNFEQQYHELYMLGDYLTEDIANDWVVNDISLLEEMVQNKIISHKALEFYKEILDNFSDVSLGKKLYDNAIWTLKGLETHNFWASQRTLAKKFLAELKKAQV